MYSITAFTLFLNFYPAILKWQFVVLCQVYFRWIIIKILALTKFNAKRAIFGVVVAEFKMVYPSSRPVLAGVVEVIRNFRFWRPRGSLVHVGNEVDKVVLQKTFILIV